MKDDRKVLKHKLTKQAYLIYAAVTWTLVLPA